MILEIAYRIPRESKNWGRRYQECSAVWVEGTKIRAMVGTELVDIDGYTIETIHILDERGKPFRGIYVNREDEP